MEFQFISNNDPRAHPPRRQIRSHVMKGRNRGRTITRGWRNRDARAASPAGRAGPRPRSGACSGERGEDTAHVPGLDEERARRRGTAATDGAAALGSPRSCFAGTEWSYFQTDPSLQFTPFMRCLVYQFSSSVLEAVYPAAFCRPQVRPTHSWFGNMMSERTSFHCSLAMAATYVSFFREDRVLAAEAARHLAEAVRLLNRELCAASVQTEPTLAVVVSLAIHANMTGATPAGRVHLDAFRRMLEHRPGGFQALRETHPEFTQKVCRTEVECSLLEGTPLSLGPEDAAVQAPGMPPAPPGGMPSMWLPHPLTALSAPLQYITREVFLLCGYPGKGRLDPRAYQDILISICQRLIGFAPLGGARPAAPLDDLWQLGLLDFAMTILYTAGRLRLIYSGLVSQMALTRLAEHPFSNLGGYRGLCFWLFFIHGLSVLDGRDGRWLIPQLRARADELAIGTWEQARKHLRVFPWVDAIHDIPGRKLWDVVMPSCTWDETRDEGIKFLAFEP